MCRPLLATLATFAFLSGCATTADRANPDLDFSQELDAHINDMITAVETKAGISVAVYTPSGTYLRGFGFADVAIGEAVTPDTAFYIASSTKSFLALSMQILESEGGLSLDDSLEAFAPGADFDASLPTDQITVQDLLTHTSGLQNRPIGFLSAYVGVTSSDQVQSLIPLTVENKSAPPGEFEYTNDGYNLLAALIAQTTVTDWQDLIDTHVITPLALRHTTARMSVAQEAGWSVAKPHLSMPDGSMEVSHLVKSDSNMHSAGGMIMSGRDALTWLEFLVERGVVGGRRIVPEEIMIQSRQPLAPVLEPFGSYTRDAYGLGWYVGRYGSDTLIHHFGGFPGYRAHISYMPDRKIGVAVFVSEALAGSVLTDEIANAIYDRERGSPTTVEQIKSVQEKFAAARTRMSTEIMKRADRVWKLSLPLSEYAGTYHHPVLGALHISSPEEHLTAELGELSAQLEPFVDKDTARAELIPLSGSVISFQIIDREVSSLEWNGQRFRRH